MFDILKWQLENFLNPVNTIIAVVSLLVIYAFFFVVFTIQKKEFIDLFDMKFSVFEKETVSGFAKYFLWALLQQSLVLLPFYFISISDHWKFFLSTIIFSCIFHFPNPRLMLFTFVFSVVFYTLWFFFGFQSLVYLTILHSLGGTLYHQNSWEMRVWWLYWNRNK